MNNKTNLLNNNSVYSLSDYQQVQLAKSYDELYNKTLSENKKILLKMKIKEFII